MDAAEEVRTLTVELLRRRRQQVVPFDHVTAEWTISLPLGKRVHLSNLPGPLCLRLMDELPAEVLVATHRMARDAASVEVARAAVGCNVQTEVIRLGDVRRPYGLCVDADSGVVFVTHNEAYSREESDGRILFMDAKTGKRIREIPIGPGHRTRGVAVQSGSIYVSAILRDPSHPDDEGNERGCIMKFASDQVDSKPESYIGISELKTPDGLAVGPDGHLYVLDTTSHSVHVFGPDGKTRHTWGSYGQEAGQFNIPNSIAGHGDRLYISDWGNDRIQQFTLDGRFVRQWGSTGHDNGQFCYPTGIVAHGDRVYVADCFNNRLQVFTHDGTFVISFGDFSLPCGIAVCNGRVWVCNSLDRSLRRCM